MPFQVAYVIDPVQNQRGFFQWKNGRIEKLKGYYIYDAVGKPIKIEQTKIKKEQKKTQAKPSRLLYSIVGILGIMTIVLAAAVIVLASRYQRQSEKQKAILSEIDNQNAMLSHQEDKLSKIQEQLEAENENRNLHTDDETTAEDKETVDDKTVTVDEKKKPAAEEEKEEGEGDDFIQFKVYTVVRGDTLVKICEANNIDYTAKRKIILTVNGIEDASQIYAGQELLLPIDGKKQ